MSWYNTGYDSIGKEEQRLATLSGPGRLWIPAGESREVVLIDDEPVTIYEHNPRMNNSWKNWMTCLKGIEDPCPACKILGENTRYYVGYFTAVDCSKWKDKRGNEHQYELTLVGAKLKSMKMFRRKKEDGTTLAGKLWKVTRDSKDDAVIGNDWELKRDVDMEKLFGVTLYRGKKLSEIFAKAAEEDSNMKRLESLLKVAKDDDGKLISTLVPFNYFDVLHPMTAKAMTEALGGVDEEQGGGEGGGGDAEDEQPF